MSEINGDSVGDEIERIRKEFNRYGFFFGKARTDPSDEPQLSTETIVAREKKWRNMCADWEHCVANSWIKLRNRCRKGIPDSMRCEAWQRLCSSPMVLVSHTKVIVHDSKMDPKSSSSKTDSSLKDTLMKPFLSVINERRTTPSFITTSASLRINRSNADARRKMILRKLYGNAGTPVCEEEKPDLSRDCNSLVVTAKWINSTASRDSISGPCPMDHRRGFPSCELVSLPPEPPTWSTATSSVSIEPSPGTEGEQKQSTITAAGPNGDLSREPSPNPLAASLRNFDQADEEGRLGSDTNPVQDSDFYPKMTSSAPFKPGWDLHLPPLASHTISRQRRQTFRSFFTLRVGKQRSYSVLDGVSPTVGPAASSSSGGYASLSTTSSAIAAAPALVSRQRSFFSRGVDARDRDSIGSYRSSVLSTTSSVLLARLPICGEVPGATTQSLPAGQRRTSTGGGRSSVQSLVLMGQDARATLVPSPGDLDPVGLYHSYCQAPAQPSCCDQIRMDLDRQFPNHELFYQKDGHGQQMLYALLKAYTVRHPEKGYCQGQAPLAAVILMFMPEVDAFWTFNEICERYLDAYYDEGLERVQIDAEILYTLLKGSYIEVYQFLRKHSIDPLLIVLEWFMCAFTRTLPWSVVLRVLDMFFCEGKVVLFRVAVVLLRRMFGTTAQRNECGSANDILLRVRNILSVVNNTDEFVNETLRLGLNPRDLAQEAVRHSRKWAKRKEQETGRNP